MEERERVTITGAWRESSRPQKALIGVMLIILLGNCIVHLVSWARHSNPVVPNFDVIVMLVIVIFHSVMVKGRRQTVALFVTIATTSWFFEFIGNNYGWFFGHYKYTEAAGPRIGGVAIFVVFTWCVIVYTSFMLIDWLVGTEGKKRACSWGGRCCGQRWWRPLPLPWSAPRT